MNGNEIFYLIIAFVNGVTIGGYIIMKVYIWAENKRIEKEISKGRRHDS